MSEVDYLDVSNHEKFVREQEDLVVPSKPSTEDEANQTERGLVEEVFESIFSPGVNAKVIKVIHALFVSMVHEMIRYQLLD